MQQEYPLFSEIPFSTAQIFATKLDTYTDICFFHSARLHEQLARYSFIALDPFAKTQGDMDNVFDFLSHQLNTFRFATHPHLPPFQGGLAGYLSYDLVRDLEILPNHAIADYSYPKLILGFYDVVIAMDHIEQRAWVFSSGFPEQDPARRFLRAKTRLQWVLTEINQAVLVKTPEVTSPVFTIPDKIKSNFSRSQYIAAVNKIKTYIQAGDIFEANLSQRFHCDLPAGLSPFQLYQRLSVRNPAPFAAYINFGDIYIISSSPERFIKVYGAEEVPRSAGAPDERQRVGWRAAGGSPQAPIVGAQVETRPIKGTARRSASPSEDAELAIQLQNSEKNRAENMMIVDVMRNDLSKVCLPHSVRVPHCCQIESYENVHQLVSVIQGTLRSEFNRIDLLKATLAGGSITGAPKIRAMEIIDELEPTRRGPYCGNAIYLGFDGAMDSSIIIRSYVIYKNRVTFQSGGAIVLDSDPLQEYQETLIKAQLLRETLTKP